MVELYDEEEGVMSWQLLSARVNNAFKRIFIFATSVHWTKD